MNYNKIEDDDENLSNYYDKEEDSDDNKEKSNVKYYKNQPYDIAFNINDSVDENSSDNLEKEKKSDKNRLNASKFEKMNTKNKNEMEDEEEKEEDEDDDDNYNEDKKNYDYKAITDKNKYTNPTPQPNLKPLPKFNLTEFNDLQANGDIKSLLQIMTKFIPQEISLETKLRPFIPGFIPNIGEVDAFIKVNRPDGQQEDCGLSVIDEPITNGLDPYILKLMLIDETKQKVDRYEVRSIPNSEKNPKAIQSWIDKVADMRKTKVSSSVVYSKNYPHIESLMQVWPEKMESTLKEISFPDERLNLSIENYSKLICNIIDIPVHTASSNKSLIESLHVLFTLYSEFKQNQHFQRSTTTEKEGDVQSKMFY